MTNFRLIEKGSVPENPTRNDFVDYLLFETGGTVSLDEGPIEEHSDKRYWKVPCFSFDGRSGPATRPAKAVFPNSGCLSDAQIDEQIRRY